MKKAYLAHPISTTGEFNDSIRVAERIEEETMIPFALHPSGDYHYERKFSVYAPALNKEINDKSNNPTPQMIYKQDVQNLLASDIIVMNYTGGDSDGTVLEMGLLGGLVEAIGVLSEIKNDFQNNQEEILSMMLSIKYSTGKTLIEREVKNVYHLVVANAIARYVSRLPKVFVYSSNQRATKPQLYNLALKKLYEAGVDDSLEGFIPSGKLNAMVIGLVEEYFVWCANEDDVIRKLRDYDG